MPKKLPAYKRKSRAIFIRVDSREHGLFSAAASVEHKTVAEWFRWLAKKRLEELDSV